MHMVLWVISDRAIPRSFGMMEGLGVHTFRLINAGRVSYTLASLDGHSPEEATPARGFVSYQENVSGPRVRERSNIFSDHYEQARLFWNSMSPTEKEHIFKALQFELSLVETAPV